MISGKNIEEIHFEKEGKKFKIKQQLRPLPCMPSPIPPVTSPKPNGYEKITSPMVGRFYPQSKNNEILEKGKILCVIESMRLRNEVEVKKKCRIINTFVQNGDPVEYGQPLFLVEPI